MSFEIHAVQWAAIYSTVALLICARLLYYTNKQYDWADWQFNRNKIFGKVMRRVFLWPFFLATPRQLIKPSFNFTPSGFFDEDGAELARKQTDFMGNPPPCGSTISFSGDQGWSSIKGVFLFPSQIAHEFAIRKWRDDKKLPGIRGAIWWLATHDDSLMENTPVPKILMNFDQIAQDMIDAGVGQVRCPECDKIYEVSEITPETSKIDSLSCCSTVWKSLKCPEDHMLMSYEYMRLFFGHSKSDSIHKQDNEDEFSIRKFTSDLD